MAMLQPAKLTVNAPPSLKAVSQHRNVGMLLERGDKTIFSTGSSLGIPESRARTVNASLKKDQDLFEDATSSTLHESCIASDESTSSKSTSEQHRRSFRCRMACSIDNSTLWHRRRALGGQLIVRMLVLCARRSAACPRPQARLLDPAHAILRSLPLSAGACDGEAHCCCS